MHDLDKLNRERRGAETAKLDAARAMLAALQEIASQVHNLPRSATADRIDEISHAAITAAKAAGIKAEG